MPGKVDEKLEKKVDFIQSQVSTKLTCVDWMNILPDVEAINMLINDFLKQMNIYNEN